MRLIFWAMVPLLVFVGSDVFGQGKTYEPHNTTAILKIVFTQAEGMQSVGSCVAIDDCHVLTAAHVVGSSVANVETKEGKVPAKVVALDCFHDRALLRCVRPITQKPRAVRDKPIQNGEPLFAIGFGGNGFGYTRCRADGKQIRGRSIPGDSGGPVCDAAGNVVGLITGYSGDGFLLSPSRADLSKWAADNRDNDPIDIGP